MKTLLRYIYLLFLLCAGVAANAQTSSTTLVLADMTKVSDSPLRWRYGTVECESPNNVTSITLSMKNNQLSGANTSSISHTGDPLESLGNDPRTITYLFNPAITANQVELFLKGFTFQQTTEHAGVNPWVDITVDANPTRLPAGATITVWKDHPDGSVHYYVWVASSGIDYGPAYSEAKTYYFQGMRGYMATITSEYESELLTEISKLEGWSGGARTTDVISDKRTSISNPTHSNSGIGIYYRWLCGPETDFRYYQGPKYNSTGAGPMNNAFSGWNPTEPNDSSSENCMQVNHTNLRWNDYYAWNDNIKGYFIEFGGTGKEYKVGLATYPANDKYNEAKLTIPNGGLTNDQWERFSPGNRVSTSTTFKPNSMRANVLVLE